VCVKKRRCRMEVGLWGNAARLRLWGAGGVRGRGCRVTISERVVLGVSDAGAGGATGRKARAVNWR